jgi:hypothetical protein
MKTLHLILAGGLVLVVAAFVSLAVPSAQQVPSDGPQFTPANELIRPTDFREWVFVSAGLGMTYNEPAAAPGAPPRAPSFTNVYVNPSSYRSFTKTGQWPDKTMFILEIRASQTEGSINKGGSFQGPLRIVEASVKDETRFPGKWGYFNFGADMKERVAALPATATCYACHATHAAVDNTFVQFYPTLLEVAKEKGTLRAAH